LANEIRELQVFMALADVPATKGYSKVALAMTRPTRNSRTGTCLVRIAISAGLREAAERMFGLQREFRTNRPTKDPSQGARTGRAHAATGQSGRSAGIGFSGARSLPGLHMEIAMMLLKESPAEAVMVESHQARFIPVPLHAALPSMPTEGMSLAFSDHVPSDAPTRY
jgi:hypothetical protein